MRRVLMGDFGAIVRAGFQDILEDQGVQLLKADGIDLLERLVQHLPDVVVLDLDRSGTSELVQRITADFPALKVVACSTEQPIMRIFPPFHRGESFERELDLDAFISIVQA